jgi:alanine dehydrogenase
MKIGVPTEIKTDEFRVAITPAGVRDLIGNGHQVLVQAGAGKGSSILDQAYAAQGARIVATAEDLWTTSDLVFKVKEPQPDEIAWLRAGQILFAYLHLAPDAAQTQGLIASQATCVAFETVTDAQDRLPLLAPMSAVAGRLATQVGAGLMERLRGGRGVLMGGVPGVAAAQVVVLGGGVVGENAAVVAAGMGADVTVFDLSLDRLAELDALYGTRLKTRYSTTLAVEEAISRADLVIGAVLVHGARAPHLITREQLALLPENAALVDVAIDQGGCFETSHPTTHSDPTFVVDGVLHYCVANMPGAVPTTSTQALANATLPYLVRLANGGLQALRDNTDLCNGLNVHRGLTTNQAVADAQGLAYTPAQQALSVAAD